MRKVALLIMLWIAAGPAAAAGTVNHSADRSVDRRPEARARNGGRPDGSLVPGSPFSPPADPASSPASVSLRRVQKSTQANGLRDPLTGPFDTTAGSPGVRSSLPR
jgi:hypothetical protein